MLEEGSAPVSTDMSCAKTVPLRKEMGGNDGKDIQWDAVDWNERVPPFADSCQCARSIPVELRNTIKSEATEQVTMYYLMPDLANESTIYLETYHGEYATRFSSSFRAKASCDNERPFPG